MSVKKKGGKLYTATLDFTRCGGREKGEGVYIGENKGMTMLFFKDFRAVMCLTLKWQNDINSLLQQRYYSGFRV